MSLGRSRGNLRATTSRKYLAGSFVTRGNLMAVADIVTKDGQRGAVDNRGRDGRQGRIIKVKYRFIGKGKPHPYEIWYEGNDRH